MIFRPLPTAPELIQCLALWVLLLCGAHSTQGQIYVPEAQADSPAPFSWSVGCDVTELLSGMAVISLEKSLLPEVSVRLSAGTWTGDLFKAGLLPTLMELDAPALLGGHQGSFGIRMYPSVECSESARLMIGFDATQVTYDFEFNQKSEQWKHREVNVILGVWKPLSSRLAISGLVSFGEDWNQASIRRMSGNSVGTDFRSWTQWGGLGFHWTWGAPNP